MLAYYDLTRPVSVLVDVSQTGLGATVLQNGHLVADSSCALTTTERNYAQIEKELLVCMRTRILTNASLERVM